MTWHRLEVTSAFPYFTNKTVQTDDDKRLQRILWAIKGGDRVTVDGKSVPSSEWFCDVFQPDSRDRPFLNRERTIVPIPKSTTTALPPDPQRWVCYDIARRLAANGYARDARAILTRQVAVRSSRAARTAGEDPPSVDEHRGSMAVDEGLLQGVTAITLLDDVVSAGRNSMGAYMRLRDAGFTGDIALMTVSYTNYTPGIRDPFYGLVIWQEGRATSFRKSHEEENPFASAPDVGPWSPEPPEDDDAPF